MNLNNYDNKINTYISTMINKSKAKNTTNNSISSNKNKTIIPIKMKVY